MASNFVNRGGDVEDVVLGHVFADANTNAVRKDRFRFGAFVLREIHVRQTQFLNRPTPGKETVLLKDRLAV